MLFKAEIAPIECLGVDDDLLGVFFECNEDTALSAAAKRIDDGLQGKNCLARAWPAFQQRRAIGGQTAMAQFIESWYTRPGFAQRLGGDVFQFLQWQPLHKDGQTFTWLEALFLSPDLRIWLG